MDKSYNQVAFTQDTPLLFALADSESKSKRNKRPEVFSNQSVRVVFPLVSYRVIIQVPEPHTLNLFQQTVLRLLGIKMYSDAELAEMLLLHQSLISFVVNELTEKQYLSNRVLTQEGRNVLNGVGLNTSIKSGYIFYDPVSEDFLDTFLEDRRYHIVGKEYEGGFVRFSIENSVAEGARLYKAILLKQSVKSVLPPALTADRGISICRSAIKKLWERQRAEFDEEVSRCDLGSYGVRVVSDPEPIYAVTVIHAPNRGIQKYVVSDPFELKPSGVFQEHIDTIIRNKENLDLSRLINKIFGNKGLAENEKHELKNVQKEKKQEISEQLLNAIGVKPDDGIISSLCDAVICYKSLSDSNISENNLGRYVSSCYTAVERALVSCFNSSMEKVMAVSRDFTCASMLCDDNRYNGLLLEEIALNYCHFDGDSILRIKDFLGNIKKNSIIGSEDSDLRVMIAGCIILSKMDSSNPFLNTSGVSHFLVDMIYLKQFRDPYEHEGIINFLFEEVSEYMLRCVNYVGWLLTGEKIPEEKLNQFAEKLNEKHSKLVTQMDNAIREDCLAEMQAHGIIINNKSAALDGLLECSYSLKQDNMAGFVKAAALFLELTLKYFAVDKDVVSEFIDSNSLVPQEEKIAELCMDLKCLPEDRTFINEFFRSSNIYNFYSEKPVCSSSLFYRLICAQKGISAKFAKYLQGRACYINDICFIHILRGHNGAGTEKKMKEYRFDCEKAKKMLNRFYDYFSVLQ